MATTEKIAALETELISFSVNGRTVELRVNGTRRLSRVLRDDLGLVGTKVGCDAGDCGACTVLLNGDPVCACLVAAGQAAGCEITTVEGLAQRARRSTAACSNHFSRTVRHNVEPVLQECWSRRRLCWSGIHLPSENEVMDAIGGVLCRCTGYRKIISAVMVAGAAQGPCRSLANGGRRSGRGSCGSMAGRKLTARRFSGRMKFLPELWECA